MITISYETPMKISLESKLITTHTHRSEKLYVRNISISIILIYIYINIHNIYIIYIHTHTHIYILYAPHKAGRSPSNSERQSFVKVNDAGPHVQGHPPAPHPQHHHHHIIIISSSSPSTTLSYVILPLPHTVWSLLPG